MFSNFEPLRGLEPRTHALRMRNMVLKISELDERSKNLYRNKTKKISYYIYFSDLDLGERGWRVWGWRGRSEDMDWDWEEDTEDSIDMEDWL